MPKKGTRKVTIILDRSIVKALELYKAQSKEYVSISDTISKAVRQYLDDPFKWNESEQYHFAFPKDDEDW